MKTNYASESSIETRLRNESNKLSLARKRPLEDENATSTYNYVMIVGKI